MEHYRDRVKEIGQQLAASSGGLDWPIDLLLALDNLSTEPFLHLVGHFESEGEFMRWGGAGCTERGIIAFAGVVGAEGRLQGAPSVIARRISDLRSLSVVEIQQVDEYMDFGTRACLRLEFDQGTPIEITTIGVRNGRTKNAIEAMVAYIRDRASIA